VAAIRAAASPRPSAAPAAVRGPPTAQADTAAEILPASTYAQTIPAVVIVSYIKMFKMFFFLAPDHR
jgi:hypothetical protein